ncbi:HNH endonuclease [Staphylospora marina]|uniref:HNH endonuclease n=1 Tax=Staphylospora marina TaxID=2490858 RepID=UPI000F5BDFAD|nr:HNH endonuclease signature motif containing protein [Staphylospora marina]
MKKARPFYKSAAWLRCREAVLIRDNHLCQLCLKRGKLTPANTVHHIEHLEDNPDRALEADNLISICATCHNRLHPEKGRKKREEKPRRARIIRADPNDEMAAFF